MAVRRPHFACPVKQEKKEVAQTKHTVNYNLRACGLAGMLA